eukprot:234536-Prymnesium_polylepis.1
MGPSATTSLLSDRCVGGAVPRWTIFPRWHRHRSATAIPLKRRAVRRRIAQRRTGCAATEAFRKPRPLSPAR